MSRLRKSALFRPRLVSGQKLFPSDRLTKAFFARAGVEQFNGVRPPRSKVHVSLSSLPTALFKPDGSVNQIVVSNIGRLGNAYLQLHRAIRLAHLLGVKSLLVEPVEWLRNEFTLPSGLRVTQIGVGGSTPRLGRVLWGRFFYAEEFPQLGFPPAARSDIASIRHFLSKTPENALADDHLVVHLRGGDVFSQGPGERLYGQPPLAFYQTILASQNWSEVTVVHQDESNPVLEPLCNEVISRGIPLQRVSGLLLDDFQVLLSASSIVLSSGTFGRAILDLSADVRTAYLFDSAMLPEGENDRVVIRQVRDRCEEYVHSVMHGNWDKSPEKTRLMLEYPVDCLELEHVDLGPEDFGGAEAGSGDQGFPR